jgi:hypothetical protein
VSLLASSTGRKASSIILAVLLLRVNHYITLVNQVGALISLILSHLVDGRNQTARSAIKSTRSVELSLARISPNYMQQTNYVVILIISFISFMQNTYVVILLHSVCGVIAMHN